MDTVTLSKQNRLFWLGRYAERAYTTIQYIMKQYDRLIDGGTVHYETFCEKMGVPCVYDSGDDFCRRYLFDSLSPCSVRSSVEAMLGNGMVLRETITSPTLAYLQMAHTAMELAAKSEAPGVELQWVLDDIMAFRGSFDDSVEVETARNITKTGSLVERISLMLRLDWQLPRLDRELQKLINRLYKTDLTPEKNALEVITRRAVNGEDIDRILLLNSVEGLFRV
ncbi:MAG: alpha-E domain-containing protein [Oscillospiraceae bacterium]|nr:alpha-E domain-containing protein [Oscillospiraceae bacterium]